MILSIGELLADMVGKDQDGTLVFEAHCGGAPFNCAHYAHKAGAKVEFVGRVGKDPIGRFLKQESSKAHFEKLVIEEDPQRNTTLAFVSLTNGERDFAFHRHDTADYHIETALKELAQEQVRIVHLGSLMLSEEQGRILADAIIAKTKELGKLLSFDVNYREDTYKSREEAIQIFTQYCRFAQILKVSDDELKLLTGEKDLPKAVALLANEEQLVVVTQGKNGSTFFYRGKTGHMDTFPIKPVDTTGAGDAFFGTFLAKIETTEWTQEHLLDALKEANEAGAKATQFLGAVELS